MSALEQEIIEKFHLLDKDAQQRVRAALEESVEPEPFDYEAWARGIDAVREQIRQSNGGVFPSIDAIGMLREIRDGEDDE